MTTIFLTPDEILELDRQDASTKSDGGWQGLIVRLQQKVLRKTGQLDLDDKELEQIARYAFDYRHGGWETRLKLVLERSLGPTLGR